MKKKIKDLTEEEVCMITSYLDKEYELSFTLSNLAKLCLLVEEKNVNE